jgi:hypothetical protein
MCSGWPRFSLPSGEEKRGVRELWGGRGDGGLERGGALQQIAHAHAGDDGQLGVGGLGEGEGLVEVVNGCGDVALGLGDAAS